MSWLNDGVPDCANGEDEEHHLLPSSDYLQKCTANNALPCGHSVKQCYPLSDHCLYETEYTGYISYCRRGTHLMDCADFECSSTYKCLEANCIPYGRLCDGTIDCPDGSDETFCGESCQGLFLCQQEDICLSEHQVCNGKIECTLSGDDEKYCIKKSQNFIDLQTDRATSKLSFDTRLHPVLQVVRYCSSGITALENKLSADKQLAIKTLDLSDNILTEIRSMTFWNFLQSRYIFLNKNKITNIYIFAFHGVTNVFILDLSNNDISYLSLHTFDSCTIYNLDLSHNPISQADHTFFTEVQVGGTLFPATEQMCCMLFEGDLNALCSIDWKVSVCRDLLVSDVIAYLMGLMCLFCMVSNFYCLFKHYGVKTYKGFTVLTGNLSTANLAIIPYLVILGVQHLVYKGVFYYENHNWPTSIYCNTAAVSSFISQQMSLTMVVVISVQRALVTSFPIKFKSVSSKMMSHIVAGVSWSLWFFAGFFLILTNNIDALKISISNDVCLYQDLRFAGPLQYVFSGMFLGVNIVFHVIIVTCSYITYKSVARSKNISKYQEKHKRRIMRVRKKMLAVVISDIVSNLPMITVSSITLCGLAPSNLIWGTIALIAVPLCSVINPVVYM